MQSPRTSNARSFDLMEDAGLGVCGLPALAIDSTAESHPFLRPCSGSESSAAGATIAWEGCPPGRLTGSGGGGSLGKKFSRAKRTIALEITRGALGGLFGLGFGCHARTSTVTEKAKRTRSPTQHQRNKNHDTGCSPVSRWASSSSSPTSSSSSSFSSSFS